MHGYLVISGRKTFLSSGCINIIYTLELYKSLNKGSEALLLAVFGVLPPAILMIAKLGNLVFGQPFAMNVDSLLNGFRLSDNVFFPFSLRFCTRASSLQRTLLLRDYEWMIGSSLIDQKAILYID